MKGLTILLALVLFEANGIFNTRQSIKDFNYAIEITTVRQRVRGTVGRTRQYLNGTVGRTRQTLMRSQVMPEENMLGINRTENYCCFWLYQKHPALPDNWEHREDYPFDFLFNGEFVKNERSFKDVSTQSD
ncbi:hypothetical protein ACLKA7_009607 [Drosophila subpalustris]